MDGQLNQAIGCVADNAFAMEKTFLVRLLLVKIAILTD